MITEEIRIKREVDNQIKLNRARNKNKRLCPYPHCQADLDVWQELGLGEHYHFEVNDG